jgi:hypothetical protein
VARIVDELGNAVILKNNTPRYGSSVRTNMFL